MYYYLLNTQGEDAAYEYLDSLQATLNKRGTEFDAEDFERYPAVFTTIPKFIGDATAFVSDSIKTAKGEDIDPYDNAHYLKNMVDASRQGNSEMVDEAFGGANIFGFGMGDLYSTGLSAVDMLEGQEFLGAAGSALGMNNAGKFASATYSALMSMGAAEDAAKDAYDKGASRDQIIEKALTAGAFEYIFEKVSLDLVVGDFIQGNYDKGQLAKALLTSAGVEGSEEVLTEAANYVADIIIIKKSNRNALPAIAGAQ